VLWSRGADGRLALRWREIGGPATRAPSYRGVGMGVIERSVRDQLGGQASFHWHDEGLLCEIDAPSETLTGL
jgi:two-component sensor histidine kinase